MQNPVQGVVNTQKTMKMLDKMEFICVIDAQMSDTAWYADIVLPHSTYLERWDPAHSLSGIWPVVEFRQPVIDPVVPFHDPHYQRVCRSLQYLPVGFA